MLPAVETPPIGSPKIENMTSSMNPGAGDKDAHSTLRIENCLQLFAGSFGWIEPETVAFRYLRISLLS
jgi:hypothetical protein